MQIVDTHVHFWDPEQLRYPWLDELDELRRPFLAADYAAATAGTGIAGLIFVQADCLPEQGLAEVDWVAGLEAPLLGIVGFAQLELGEGVRPQLEQLRHRPLVKGVRRLIQSESAEFAIQPDFVRGVQLLAEYGFSFDICVKHHQLPAVLQLVQQCPEVRFVLDHIGKPDIAGGEMKAWRVQIDAIADLANVWCKLSGVITEANWTRWTSQSVRPYVEQVVNAFGIDRLMFGSDWPVVNLAGSFAGWLEALAWLDEALSEMEKRKFFSENGIDFYGAGRGA
jgi:L-fuconolactonase